MKATAIAPTNIAFVKYWGRTDEHLRLAQNGSISLCLSGLTTTTTVSFEKELAADEVMINDLQLKEEAARTSRHLDLIRALAKTDLHARIVSINSFPTATGLSSSASGFAALTVAAAAALQLDLDEKELSILARQGSGSACRSIPDGWVEWLAGDTSETSYAESIYPPDHWDLVDIVAVVSEERKAVTTTKGQQRVQTSPFFQARRAGISQKITEIKQAIADRDFTKFGEITEAEALNMHAVMLTSRPALIYWTPGTLEIMKLCARWRSTGLEVYFTINTGQDIHLLVQKKDADRLQEELRHLPFIRETIVSHPSVGVQLQDEHLF